MDAGPSQTLNSGADAKGGRKALPACSLRSFLPASAARGYPSWGISWRRRRPWAPCTVAA